MHFSHPRLKFSVPSIPFAFLFSAIYLPALVSATRADSDIDVPSPLSASPSSSGSTSSHLSLTPITATTFSLCIIFGLLTALQLYPAYLNILKHTPLFSPFFLSGSNHPPPPTPAYALPSSTASLNPTFPVGPIFPLALFSATLCLFATYILRAAFWGLSFNQSAHTVLGPGPGPESGIGNHGRDRERLITAWAVFTYLTDVFIVMSCFSFVCFRVRRLCYCTCRSPFYFVKRVFDMVLVGTLFALGTVWMGYRAGVIAAAKAQARARGVGGGGSWVLEIGSGELGRLVALRRAYDALLVFAAVDVALSAIMLYQHAGKYQSVPDRKVAMHIGGIIAPLMLLYTLFPFISHEYLRAQQDRISEGLHIGTISQILGAGVLASGGSMEAWDLGRVLVTCFTMLVVIALLLKFGGISIVDALRGKGLKVQDEPQMYGYGCRGYKF